MATLFRKNDKGYLKWIARNPDGYVVNTRREFDPDYVVLHRASCPSMRIYRGMADNPGGFTERGYLKLCSTSIDDLRTHVKILGGRSAAFSKECGRCAPTRASRK